MDKKKLIQKYRESLLQKENVEGVSRGLKVDEDGNIISDEEVILVTVKEKKPESELNSQDIVPKSLEGVETIVRDFGSIKAHNSEDQFKDSHRPLRGGASFGYEEETTGTLGMTFIDEKNRIFLLSNNHVIGDTNSGRIGGRLNQPAFSDCGEDQCYCGTLERYVELNFKDNPISSTNGLFSKITSFFNRLFGGGKKSGVIEVNGNVNKVDCALGELAGCSTVLNNVIELGEIQGIREPELGMNIKKVGRTSGVTEGRIIQMDATLHVNFSFGRKAIFEDQIITTPISEPGDSGSVVLDEDNYLIGLLFSGSEKVSVMNKIDLVFDALNVNPKFD